MHRYLICDYVNDTVKPTYWVASDAEAAQEEYLECMADFGITTGELTIELAD